jgi:uncharacterized membrane protein YccF (DUF307 family)
MGASIAREFWRGCLAVVTRDNRGYVTGAANAAAGDAMRLLLNILWAIVGGGFAIALQYALGGLVLCCTIVGIPFGLQCFKLARLGLFPFGKDIVDEPIESSSGLISLFMNILWLVFGGLTTFMTHIVLCLTLAITIIGIPFAMQHLKLAVLALFPFGRRIIETA